MAETTAAATAVDKAKAAADAAFMPPKSLLNASTAAPLLRAVDGPNLALYEGKESVYVGRSVPIGAGAHLEIPINVTAPDSVVEYAVELQAYDIAFGIVAEREEGNTVVKEKTRVAHGDTPLTQKFLVRSVPCLIQFRFDNDYSWMREKVVSYKITVTPPSAASLTAGRRRRTASCLRVVQDDLKAAQTRLEAASQQKMQLQREVADLMKELQEKKAAWQVAEKEEAWLQTRQALRKEQVAGLQQRLEHGWPDEKDNAQRTNGK